MISTHGSCGMSIIKGISLAFIISTVSSYMGYIVKGGSVEVSKASTDAVVSSARESAI